MRKYAFYLDVEKQFTKVYASSPLELFDKCIKCRCRKSLKAINCAYWPGNSWVLAWVRDPLDLDKLDEDCVEAWDTCDLEYMKRKG